MIASAPRSCWPCGWTNAAPFQEMSIQVANNGSIARDHLANERTFLAWLRTAVAAIGLGLAIAKFSVGRRGLVGGLLFIAVGMILLIYSGSRYFSVERSLREGRYTINTGGIWVTIGVAGILAVVCTLLVLIEDDEPAQSSL